MLRNVFKWLSLLLLLISPIPVKAQGALQIDRLEVDIWPEFDRPDVLVIYRITLPASADLPLEMSLRIPSVSGSPYNVAMKDVDGMLYNLNYTLRPEGDWINVTFTALSTELQLEYYDPTMQRSEASRSFEYQWPGDYGVKSFMVLVQQPLNAVNFRIEPDMGSGRLGEDDLTYYMLVVGQLDEGSPWKVRLSYENPSSGLSADLQPVQPLQPIPNQPEDTTIVQRYLLWGSVILGGLFILAGAFWFWRSRGETESTPLRRRNLPESAGAPSKKSAEGGVYCQQCGKLSIRGDAYCRACGSRLRTD